MPRRPSRRRWPTAAATALPHPRSAGPGAAAAQRSPQPAGAEAEAAAAQPSPQPAEQEAAGGSSAVSTTGGAEAAAAQPYPRPAEPEAAAARPYPRPAEARTPRVRSARGQVHRVRPWVPASPSTRPSPWRRRAVRGRVGRVEGRDLVGILVLPPSRRSVQRSVPLAATWATPPSGSSSASSRIPSSSSSQPERDFRWNSAARQGGGRDRGEEQSSEHVPPIGRRCRV